MKLAILQPCLVPDLHYIASLKKADKIIISENDMWSRKGRTNRFLIRTHDGLHWVTWPVQTEDKKKPINKVRLDHSDKQWFSKMIITMQQAYRNSIYFDHYEPEIISDFEKIREFEFLKEAISFFNQKLWNYLEWKPDPQKFLLESAFSGQNPQDVMEKLNADSLIMEEDGKNFQWQIEKKEQSIESYPVYKQHFGGFMEPCAVLDVLFEVGPEWYRIYDSL
jgi:hypothetical protein